MGGFATPATACIECCDTVAGLPACKLREQARPSGKTLAVRLRRPCCLTKDWVRRLQLDESMQQACSAQLRLLRVLPPCKPC